VVITYVCNLDEMSVTTQITDMTYVFSAAPQALTPTTVFGQLKAGCAKTFNLEVWNKIDQLWVTFAAGTHGYFISSWDSATATVTISNSGSNGGAGSLKPQT
jgi:hypothetical protein